MAQRDLLDQLADLFRETARAHHEAFMAIGGADPDWPLWYANYLLDRLPRLLNTPLTKSELVYLLEDADKTRARLDPDAPWDRYYARLFADRYIYIGQP